ncbi:penicillin acylase family protein [Kordiimonas aquimaris]|uniref:penicillin acylase family protein n=1 Tax=Kordiimonas aquimaris TaxID=707591 RepID=UPI0021CF246F|nr:penicillin acylase family protein [Kordiimonas aquimaris]
MKCFAKVLFGLTAMALLAACSAEQTVSDDPAKNVTIYRDTYGVPHIYGRTDGDAAFGMAYAQAEDNFAQLELNFILASGRSAEVFGEEAVLSDWIARSLEIERLSRRDYETAIPSTKALLDGYAAGLNYFLAQNPDVKPRLFTKFEPWYPLALIRRMYYMGGFLGRLDFTNEERRAAFEAINGSALTTVQTQIPQTDTELANAFGSNSWAANGPKIEGTGSYLFINPHLPSFGMGQVYEAHVISDEGWNFTGYSRFGFPLPYVGFGENLGWASTDNNGDQEDAWIEHFGESENPLAYRYDGDFRIASEWSDEIKVRDAAPVPVKFRKTHHGPVLAMRDGQLLSARFATFDEPGWLDQWHAMSRAQNFDEFKAAVTPLKMQFGNYMYADRDGHIYYVYNGAFPKKDASFDWNNPVDGSNPATEWQGYHSLEEIPQVLDAVSHFVQNTNTTPFMTSMSASDPREEGFPPYMVRESDNARSRNARRILQGIERFDFATWERESFDTTMMSWQPHKLVLLGAYEAVNFTDHARGEALAPIIDVLVGWDGVARMDENAPTLYVDWYEECRKRGLLSEQQPEEIITALETVVARLQSDWGDWRVSWGDINRAQRPAVDSKGVPQFCDDCESLATPGVPHWSGGSLISGNTRLPDLKKRYKRGGNSYTAIIDFPRDRSKRIVSRSVHVFGASVDANSQHHMDQAALLAQKQYKPAWLYLDDVKKHAVRAYHPGEE